MCSFLCQLYDKKHAVADELLKAMLWLESAREVEKQTEEEIYEGKVFHEEAQRRLNKVTIEVKQ